MGEEVDVHEGDGEPGLQDALTMNEVRRLEGRAADQISGGSYAGREGVEEKRWGRYH